jgi:hypothetical protein
VAVAEDEPGFFGHFGAVDSMEAYEGLALVFKS